MTTQSLDGTTVLLTGGTSGIGKTTATAFAGRGATTLVTGRDPEKADAAARAIRTDSGTDDVDCYVADFSSMREVRELARRVRRDHDSLDVLVNNAGVWPRDLVVTPDGVELSFAVNYLAPFVLTHELLPSLRTGAGGRVVNVSSGLHRSGRIDFETFGGDSPFDAGAAYRQSKLALVLFTYALDRRLADAREGAEAPVAATCLEPGFVPATGLYREYPWYVRVWAPLLERLPVRFVRSPADAAATYLYAATAPVTEVAGRYLADGQVVESAAACHDEELQQRLWDASVELTGVPADGIPADSVG